MFTNIIYNDNCGNVYKGYIIDLIFNKLGAFIYLSVATTLQSKCCNKLLIIIFLRMLVDKCVERMENVY